MKSAVPGQSRAAEIAVGLKAQDIEAPEGAGEVLDAYLTLIAEWNRAYNLTAVRDPGQMVTLHLLDSLSVLPFVSGDSVIDVGAGAGLPGLVLATVDTKRSYVVLDANGKKAAFMRHAVRRLRLGNVEVVQSRVEDYTGPAGGFDCVLSRAFASLADMARWCEHLLAPAGRMLAMKGRHPAQEVDALPCAFELSGSHELHVPGLDAERHLLVLRRRAGA